MIYAPFPIDLLPPIVSEYVRQAALALDCDPAYIAVPMLPALASAIGNTRRIRLKATWSEPAVIWAATVGDSGTVKSPALELATKPVWHRQRELLRRHAREMAEYRSALADWKATPKADRGAEPEAPAPCEHPLCCDITIEALADRLQATPRGTLLALDEFAAWFGSFNQYKSKGADVAHWLTLHGARALKVDRKTGDKTTTYIPHAATSITGTIQPATLRRALLPEFYENGLAARLLVTMPPTRAKKWTEHEIDPALTQRVDDLFADLYALRPDDGIDGEPSPVMVDLLEDARSAWIAFANEHNLAVQELDGDARAAWVKLEAYAARFALILHCIRVACGEKPSNCIDAEDIANGVALARWFGRETLRVYDAMRESNEDRQLRELLEWIAQRGGRVTVRDLTRGPRRYRNNAQQAELDLNALVDAGHGAWEEIAVTARGGRGTYQFCLAHSLDYPPSPPGDGDETLENHRNSAVLSPSPQSSGNQNGDTR